MLFESISLWLAGIFLGSTASSMFASTVFFIAAVVLMSAPLFIGLFMVRQGSNASAIALLLTIPAFFLGLAVGVTPAIHDQQFYDCEVRPVEYKGVTIQEYWCATRDNLNDEFGEKTFKTVLQQRS